MPIATAQQLRDRRILVTVPGTDLQIECRRPDPLQLFTNDLLPLEMFGAVIEKITTLANTSGDVIAETIKAITDDPYAYADFLDRWVCAAAVTPAVALTADEAAKDPDRCIWIEDLEMNVKAEIVRRTIDRLSTKRVSTAVAEFRRLQPARADAGRDGQTVRDTSVGVAASDGSAAGA